MAHNGRSSVHRGRLSRFKTQYSEGGLIEELIVEPRAGEVRSFREKPAVGSHIV